jgi:hypothetical protein
MLKLFQSIFRPGADKLGTYPEDLIERAIHPAGSEAVRVMHRHEDHGRVDIAAADQRAW